MRVYLDNAASTPMFPEVVDLMTESMRDLFGNPSSVHHFGRRAKASVEEARKIIANRLGASQGEIFFTSGGTEANNTALKCAVRDLGIRRIISSAIEHHSVLHTIDRLADSGVVVEHVELDQKGRPRLDDLQRRLQARASKTLVSLMHGNNELGTMIDLDTVGELCQTYGALFHTDTVQTIGHFPFNLSNLYVSFLAGSAHKFRGPKGVGFLYVSQRNIIEPLIDGGGQERQLRSGTENIAGIAGLAKALDLSCERMQETKRHILGLKKMLADRLLRKFPKVRLNGDPFGHSLYTVLSVTFPPDEMSDLLVFNLDIEGISASGGSACASGAQKGSHVLQALRPLDKGITVRFSFSDLNTAEDVEFLMEKLGKIQSLKPA